MSKLNISKRICILFVFCAATAIAAPAQTFTTLHSFDRTDGSSPKAVLIQASDGNLYGTTAYGGSNSCSYGCGTVFSITAGGELTTLHSFNGTDGQLPFAGLTQSTNGTLYGTTQHGGANNECQDGCGTVFSITEGDKLKTLHSFGFAGYPSDGQWPSAGLVRGTDGKFYGTTAAGGVDGSYGTVFSISAGGTLTRLYSFCSQGYRCPDGYLPVAGLVQGTNGKFYGTTSGGGANGDGTVFSVTAGGVLTTLRSFNGTDGANPNAGLVQSTNGKFYGTTAGGGANGIYGTVFSITAGGELTTLHSFDKTDGYLPVAGLVQGTNGSFYGTTFYGGANNVCYEGCGTIFEITPSGKLTTLHSFDETDGYQPTAGLVQDTDGKFYGTTSLGANSSCNIYGQVGCGTVFSLSVGLGPFVKTHPTSGKVGAAVTILGTNLTGATSVTFNGTSATFTVKSKSEITTKVPTGATTGTVQVVTPGGTLSSNAPFQVLP